MHMVYQCLCLQPPLCCSRVATAVSLGGEGGGGGGGGGMVVDMAEVVVSPLIILKR